MSRAMYFFLGMILAILALPLVVGILKPGAPPEGAAPEPRQTGNVRPSEFERPRSVVPRQVSAPLTPVPRINVPQPPRVSPWGSQSGALVPTLTLDNQSGEDAEVKIVGPARLVVSVPTGGGKTVNIGGGTYTLLVKYGSGDRATYSKGDSFTVTQTATSVSRITITLHKVLGGNYGTHPIGANEYNR